MIILGIESSCDETAVAAVRDGREVLATIVASQVDLHRKYGGVVPEIACRAHLQTVLPSCIQALDQARIKPEKIDAVAATCGPGLIGALLIGLTASKSLAWMLGRPLVPVNHVEAHLYAAAMEQPQLDYPFVGLVASGGHTLLCHCESPIETHVMGSTVDDAAGEAFDKVSAILGLGYPGGPAIDRAARHGDPKAIRFPRSKLPDRPYDFSFSGLKTAVLYHCQGQNTKLSSPVRMGRQETADVAASFQEAAVDVLVEKCVAAARERRVRAVTAGGGVAANSRLRERLAAEGAEHGLQVFFPPAAMCVDMACKCSSLRRPCASTMQQ